MGALDFLEGIPVVGDIVRGRRAAAQPLNTENLDQDRSDLDRFRYDIGRERAGTNVVAPTVTARTVDAPVLNTGAADAVRARELAAAQILEDRARGAGPSVGELAYQRQQGDIIANVNAGAAGARGNAAISARRAAERQKAALLQRAALDMGLIRADESTRAAGMLPGALSGIRTSDQARAFEDARLRYAAARDTAQLGQDADARNQSGYLQATQLTQQARAEAARQMLEAMRQRSDLERSKLGLTESRRREDLEREANIYQSLARGAGSTVNPASSLQPPQR